MHNSKLQFSVAAVVFCAVVCVLIWHHRVEPAYSPEVRRFRDKFDQIREGMNEAEVDAILADFPSSKSSEKREFDNQGREFSAPSATTKTYIQVLDANEWDYFIQVFLDESGYVVGKSFGEYLR